MQTLLLLYETQQGEEHAIRAIHRTFPVHALESGIGIGQIAVFLGSGRYALQITTEDGDVQERLREFFDNPEIQEFFDRLRSHIPALPLPGTQTAFMPMTAPMLVWSAGDAAEPIAM